MVIVKIREHWCCGDSDLDPLASLAGSRWLRRRPLLAAGPKPEGKDRILPAPRSRDHRIELECLRTVC